VNCPIAGLLETGDGNQGGPRRERALAQTGTEQAGTLRSAQDAASMSCRAAASFNSGDAWRLRQLPPAVARKTGCVARPRRGPASRAQFLRAALVIGCLRVSDLVSVQRGCPSGTSMQDPPVLF
jgi:hypothetical protein